MTDIDKLVMLKEASIGREMDEMEKEAFIKYLGMAAGAVKNMLPRLGELMKPVGAAAKTVAAPVTDTKLFQNTTRTYNMARNNGSNWAQAANKAYGMAYRTNPLATTGITAGAGVGAGMAIGNMTAPKPTQQQPYQQKLSEEEITELIKIAEDEGIDWGTVLGTGLAAGAGVAGVKALAKYRGAYNTVMKDTAGTRGFGDFILNERDTFRNENKEAFNKMFDHIEDSWAKGKTRSQVEGVENAIRNAGNEFKRNPRSFDVMEAKKQQYKDEINKIQDPFYTDDIRNYLHNVVDNNIKTSERRPR